MQGVPRAALEGSPCPPLASPTAPLPLSLKLFNVPSNLTGFWLITETGNRSSLFNIKRSLTENDPQGRAVVSFYSQSTSNKMYFQCCVRKCTISIWQILSHFKQKINSKMTYIRQLMGALAPDPHQNSAPGPRWGTSPRPLHHITCPPLSPLPMKMFWIRPWGVPTAEAVLKQRLQWCSLLTFTSCYIFPCLILWIK